MALESQFIGSLLADQLRSVVSGWKGGLEHGKKDFDFSALGVRKSTGRKRDVATNHCFPPISSLTHWIPECKRPVKINFAVFLYILHTNCRHH